ncbi:MAG: hypothetical protein RL437_255, partial [Actinomycetota bacterium]
REALTAALCAGREALISRLIFVRGFI